MLLWANIFINSTSSVDRWEEKVDAADAAGDDVSAVHAADNSKFLQLTAQTKKLTFVWSDVSRWHCWLENWPVSWVMKVTCYQRSMTMMVMKLPCFCQERPDPGAWDRWFTMSHTVFSWSSRWFSWWNRSCPSVMCFQGTKPRCWSSKRELESVSALVKTCSEQH